MKPALFAALFLIVVAAVSFSSAVATDESEFIARLLAGSPWHIKWEAVTGNGFRVNGESEIIFRTEDNRLRTFSKNTTDCLSCSDGEDQVVELSGDHIKIKGVSGSTIVYRLVKGKLVGKGESARGDLLSLVGSPKK